MACRRVGAVLVALIVSLARPASGFAPAAFVVRPRSLSAAAATAAAAARLPAPLARGGDSDGEGFTEAQRLRAEVESPFAQVRLFVLPALFLAASIATYFAGTSLIAAAVGAREASPSALTDLAIDLGAMGGTGYFWRRENLAREARLKRIAFGSRLAALRLSLLEPDASGALAPARRVSLSDLRRGRGQARRVVLICAAEDTLGAALGEACALAPRLAESDFVVVPLVASAAGGGGLSLRLPSLETLQSAATGAGAVPRPASQPAARASPESRPESGQESSWGSSGPAAKAQPALPWEDAAADAEGGWPVALPLSAAAEWRAALGADIEQAVAQTEGKGQAERGAEGALAARGLTIVLKKNGRVGTRRLGTPDWAALLADVEGRRAAGLDVTNI